MSYIYAGQCRGCGKWIAPEDIYANWKGIKTDVGLSKNDMCKTCEDLLDEKRCQ